MQRSKVLVALAFLAAASLVIGACAESTSTAPASTAGSAPAAVPTVSLAPADAAAAAAPAAASGATGGFPPPGDAGGATAAGGDADAGTAEGPGDGDAGASAQFRACKVDSDCVAVNRVGCCHNGWKEAVATSQKEAYAKSFTCPQAHPICPMYIVQDSRVPECDNATHQCTMVKVEDIACMGFHRNHHACPDGYHCQLGKPADLPGKCVK
jgi:hypothetical protein